MIAIRRAGPADIGALRRLVERAYRRDSARRGWTHEADLLNDERTSDLELAEALAASDRQMLLAEQDGAAVGTVSVIDLGGGKSYLGMLGVDPDVQAAGIGRALVAEAEAVAVRDFGARTMEMTVIDRRPELIAWYERRGYRATGEVRPFPGTTPVSFAMTVLERTLY
ncbi:MAG: GNAT family N-acetyltransferase [Novosphingobium sp. 12-64-8]|nr:MAG: GNAT family N-acetyltransferase [Novosphingobium sp. 12-64-8]